ncbi:hypothetical protein NFI96_021382 [Prochilodus magdalenae]|nr:hypothetical protein NFI96_021382 [Prochilodus magdalenae]
MWKFGTSADFPFKAGLLGADSASRQADRRAWCAAIGRSLQGFCALARCFRAPAGVLERSPAPPWSACHFRKSRSLARQAASRAKVRKVLMEWAGAPLFTFGVIADIQYADLDDGYNFHATRRRFYRNSLGILRDAIRWWEEEEEQERRPGFILQLGDIIDGFNHRERASESALQTVLAEFANCSAEVHHVWGNHEFYNFSREELFKSALNTWNKGEGGEGGEGSAEDAYVYHFSPAPKFRFVVLDGYDLSILGRDESSMKYRQSLKLIQEHNPNEELNVPAGFSQLEGRFVKFNGGFSQEQLEWLDRVLVSADEKKEKVIIVCHIAVHPFSTRSLCLAWNYDKILSILNSHKSVVCFMTGHNHDGGYYRDEYGVHHLTLEGVIETPPGSNAFGTVYVYEDKMVLRGKGHVPVHPYSTDSLCLAWNYDEILPMLNSHKSVVCFIAGHDHDGGYCRDEYGVHYLTLEGVVETCPGSNAFGTVYVYEDKMILRGMGRTPDRVLIYR